MAERQQQGTGRHPHKDTQEPWSHTKDEDRREGHAGEGHRAHEHEGAHRGEHANREVAPE